MKRLHGAVVPNSALTAFQPISLASSKANLVMLSALPKLPCVYAT